MSKEDFVIQKGELSGFSLCGWVQRNGTIRMDGSKPRYISGWPEEITLLGVTYTLEETEDGSVNEENGEKFQNALYV